MASIQITRRLRLCVFVESAIAQFAGKVADALEARLTPYLKEDETMPSFHLVLQLLGRYLGDLRSRLASADQANLDEVDEDEEVRDRRNEKLERVRQVLIAQRDILVSAYGRKVRKMLGFQRRTAREPVALLRQARRVLDHYLKPDLTLPEPKVEFEPDFVGFAKELREAMTELSEVADEIQVERRKADATQLVKDAETEFFDGSYIPIARVAEAFFILAGFRKLARRIRPSTQTQIGRPADSAEGLDLGEADESEDLPDPGSDEPETPEEGEPEDPVVTPAP